MKIKQIEAILKSTKTIIVTTADDCQWLSNGEAYYPVYNFPKLTKENVFTMFDIPEDKHNKFYYDERSLPNDFNFNDYDSSEIMLEREAFSIAGAGYSVLPLKTKSEIIFANERYLKPFSDMEQIELYLRKNNTDVPYIAVKNGMLLVGIIMPSDIISERFLKNLESLYEMTFDAYRKKKEHKERSEHYQYSLNEEEKTNV